MVEFVVGSERRQRAHAHAVREEDLRGAVDPHERVKQPGDSLTDNRVKLVKMNTYVVKEDMCLGPLLVDFRIHF